MILLVERRLEGAAFEIGEGGGGGARSIDERGPIKHALDPRCRAGRMGTRHVHDAQIAVPIFISSTIGEMRGPDIHGSTWKLACGV